ncbi:MMPL family transporter [Litorihabitans aurantiacus]|uniref:MMPL family transporter n=1 Tax=Litorihabitans aurantiacus TaxID=1930061 RepID=UPI0024E15DC9|nr:MMPL family transporter [Litorihabitans aurantiacus]
MFARLGRTVTRRPRSLLVLWILLAIGAGGAAMTPVLGDPLFAKLETGDPGVPGSQSMQVQELLADAGDGASTTILVDDVDLADAGTRADLEAVLAPAREDLAAIDGVAQVVDPLLAPDPTADPALAVLVSTQGDAFVLRVTLEPGLAGDSLADAEDAVEDRLRTLAQDVTADGAAGSATVSNTSIIVSAVNHQMERDLIRGELVALPIALLVMVVVFGGALAAGMPIVGAIASILSGLGAIMALSYVMELDSVVINVVTVLGLGLSIDYGLLVVSRFREELRRLVDEVERMETAGIPVGRRRRGGRRRDPLVVQAVETTVATAGRTVFFSALTIAISVLGLAAFPADLLKALGVAGALVVVLALATALTLVPALLMLSGRRFLRPSILSRVPGLRAVVGKLGDVAPDIGVFSRLTSLVQKRPLLTMLGAIAALVVMASPLLGLQLRNSGIDMLPRGSEQQRYLETLGEEFPAVGGADVFVVATDAPDEAALATTTEQLAALDGVASVDPAADLGDGQVLLGLRLDVEDAGGAEAVAVVNDARALDPSLLVGGQAAGQVDFGQSLIDGLPVAAGLVIAATFVLLFLMTGSVLVPLKALVTNLLSIAASLGVTTWVFQEGHLSGLLRFESVGGVESYIVAVVVAFGFGLAMDYEVFLLSRVKELYDGGASNDDAVRLGLQRSGRIITSAALVIIVVFAGFATSSLLPIKQAGFALALAVALDATLVRMLLVPATMTVLGDANWWAPRWLRPIARRLSLQH